MMIDEERELISDLVKLRPVVLDKSSLLEAKLVNYR